MSFRVNNLIYSAGADLINTHRTTVTLNEPVDPQLLAEAIRKAAVRFPYFAVKVVRKDEEYVLEPNSEPFVISPKGEP